MSDPELPLVSVCIPTYNRAERLRRAVDRLQGGSYSNLEIIISDNASTDHTRELCEDLCRRDSRIRYFRQPVNRGLTANFEFARCQATGEYFLWHGDDDYLAADYISGCVQELERHPELILCSGRAAYHSGDHAITRYGNIIRCDAKSPLERVLRYLLQVQDNSIFCGVYRRVLVAHCTFPNALCGDWEWLAEVLSEGPARVLPQLHVVREEGDNTSRSLHRIVEVLGLPAWHARLPWLAMPLLLANHLAFEAASYRGKPLPLRLWRWLILFCAAFTRQVVIRLGPKIPFARHLRRLLKGRASPQADAG
jgi:glycosyltransferase involved in cell wall biosynthesis